MGHFRCKCPINFSLSRHSDKLKLIGHQTDPLPANRILLLLNRTCATLSTFAIDRDHSYVLTSELSNPCANRYRFNISNFTDDFKGHWRPI